MTKITDPAAASRVAALLAAYRSTAAPIETARAQVAELRNRAATLKRRLAAEEAQRASNADAAASALADALVADPDAALDVSATVEAGAREAGDDRRREANIRLLGGAQAKLARLIEAADDELANCEERRVNAHADLLREAYQAMLDEFRLRFIALRDEVLVPMLALQDARIHVPGNVIPSEVNRGQGHVESDFDVVMATLAPGGSKREWLYHGRQIHIETREVDLDAFIADLVPPAASRRR